MYPVVSLYRSWGQDLQEKAAQHICARIIKCHTPDAQPVDHGVRNSAGLKRGPKKHTMVNGHFKSLGAFDCPTGKSGKSIPFEKDKMTIMLKKDGGR